jgi:pimeloyl-ACP methyl ester carboxylesterase
VPYPLSKSLFIMTITFALSACGGSSSGGNSDPVSQAPEADIKTLDSLVHTFSIQNDQCPNGGIEIEMGIDANSNQRLDPGEVDHGRTQTVCHGANGLDGENGTDGNDGSDGSNSLISITSATIDECPASGKKILIGVDLNANNILDVDEALQTEIICNQVINTETQIGSLVSTSAEQPGNNCAAGGVRIDTGLDVNGDQILAANEIQSTDFVCSGVNGTDGDNGQNGIDGTDGSNLNNLLIETIEEPYGENCLHGGDSHRIGLDENLDQILQENEVISASFLCNDNGAPEITFISIQKDGAIAGFEYSLLVSSTDENNSIYGVDDVELTIISKPSWLNIENSNDHQIFLKGVADGNVGDTYSIIASSTDGEKSIEKEFIITVIEGTSAVFSVLNGDVPLAIDFLLGSAYQTDGTAIINDLNPPITTAINDLSGFSATATIDLAFTAALDPSTVLAGSSVWLIELKSQEDNSLIDSLDLTSILAVSSANPFAEGVDQLAPGIDYVAEYVEFNGGAMPSIRIHPLKPLDPKTKYIVVVTDKLKDINSASVIASSEYTHLAGNEELISPYLAPVRNGILVWEQLAGGFLAAATQATQTQDNVILSYAFTTEANDDILLAMAAPENYLYSVFADTAGLERAIGEAEAAVVITTVGTILDMPFSTATEKLAIRNTATYKTALANNIAEKLVGDSVVNQIISAVAPAVSGVDGAVDTEQEILAVKLSEVYATTLQVQAANGAGALLKNVAHRPSEQDFVAIAGGSGIVVIPHDNTGLNLANPFAESMQGMLTLPQFMAKKSVDRNSFWRSRTDDGISAVGAVIDAAFGNDPLTTPAQDSDGTGNVTYRFPFAQHIEDVKVPVLVSYPIVGGGCIKPATGWPTVIFQHGITADRTASLGFANTMAAAATGCFATVAMDLPTHGIDASSLDRNGVAIRNPAFNAFNVAGYFNGAYTPFASTLAALAGANVTTYEGLSERHENLAFNAAQQVVAMNFVTGNESGNSGDMFINLANIQQTRDHSRQAVMDMLNLNASIGVMDIDGGGAGDLDVDNLYFVGHSLGAITGLTYVAVNNTIANNSAIAVKEIHPLKAVVFASPGGQLPKLLENSPSFSARILPSLAAAGLTQGMADLEKYFAVFQATLDSIDPINYTALLKSTDTPTLMFEMVGGGLINATDSNADPMAGKLSGLSDSLIHAGGYPSDTVVPNNASPAFNGIATGLSYLAGTDPLVNQLGLATVSASIAPSTDNLMLVSKLKEGTHGTISSIDAVTVFSEMITQTASFFATAGKGLTVGDADQLQVAE